jgi:hypothetical protein
MKYPIVIKDEQELSRRIQQIVKATLKEQQPDKKPVLMSKNDVCKLVGGRTLVNKGIASGNLKQHCIEGRICFKTLEVENWINKSQL